jgi:hypothetical protein
METQGRPIDPRKGSAIGSGGTEIARGKPERARVRPAARQDGQHTPRNSEAHGVSLGGFREDGAF